MQRAYQEQNWDKMIQQAKQAKQPTRSVAAYHAIALLQTGRLLNNLLDIPYQYPDLGLINRGGLPDDGTDLYLSDCLPFFRLSKYSLSSGNGTYGYRRTQLLHAQATLFLFLTERRICSCQQISLPVTASSF